MEASVRGAEKPPGQGVGCSSLSKPHSVAVTQLECQVLCSHQPRGPQCLPGDGPSVVIWPACALAASS